MREQRIIEREIAAARGDLAASLGELKDVVRDALDPRVRVRRAIDRGKREARELFAQIRAGARRHPVTAVVTVAALVAVVAAVVYVARRR
jgi:hypothetical protein